MREMEVGVEDIAGRILAKNAGAGCRYPCFLEYAEFESYRMRWSSKLSGTLQLLILLHYCFAPALSLQFAKLKVRKRIWGNCPPIFVAFT
jgi:hypothetical protein